MIVDEIIKILIKHSRSDSPIENSTLLFEGGLDLDSIAFLELVLDVEKLTGAQLRGEDLDEQALSSVGAFVAQVTSKMGG